MSDRREVVVDIGTVEVLMECPRCKEQHTIKFVPFSSLVELGGYDNATHWALCPKLSEPLLAEAKFEINEKILKEEEKK